MKMIEVEIYNKHANVFKVMLPHVAEVCSRCDGKGSHVNPSIDGHGLSRDELHDDPDFAEGYFSGRYDVSCEECKGENVVWVLDYERLTPKYKARIDYMEKQREQSDSEDYYENRALGLGGY